MCYCNCPHEDINGCCREDECTFVKNGMTPPKVLKYGAEIGSSYVNNWNRRATQNIGKKECCEQEGGSNAG